MKEKSWVIVANCERAKFYRVKKVGELEELASFVHPDGQKRARDLESDDLGRSTDRVGYGGNTYEPRTTMKDKKDLYFAKLLSTELERALSQKSFQHLYVIAESHFLGVLKRELHPKVSEKIDKCFSKDLVDQNPNVIWDLVPLVC